MKALADSLGIRKPAASTQIRQAISRRTQNEDHAMALLRAALQACNIRYKEDDDDEDYDDDDDDDDNDNDDDGEDNA
jgi:hypothetical protein